MPDQLPLPGFGSGKPTDRLFFGLFPDASSAQAVSAAAGRLRDQHGLLGSPLATGRLHLTLHHIGDFDGLPTDRVSAAIAAAEQVRTDPFDVTLDRAASFRTRSAPFPFVLLGDEGPSELRGFRRSLGVEMARATLRSTADFTPHVTLLYDDRLIEEHPIEPIRWTAREFVLVHSLLGRTQHIVLGRWPLRG